MRLPKRRTYTPVSAKQLRAETDLAKQLRATGVWTYGRWAKTVAASRPVQGDKSRVNIVSEKLTDDLISYLGPNFVDRHKGCDIVDINPGAGLWSSKLHEALQPRSHILMEPDANLYENFLKDLLDKPNVTLVPLSGIIWRNLTGILNKKYLPHQVEILTPDDVDKDNSEGKEHPSVWDTTPLPRNDTLLVTANLAFFPKRRFGMFDSISQLVLYQFINSIRATSLFHKYGLVRMLVWVEGADRHALVARSLQRRRRLALEGEMATHTITELAGRDTNNSGWYMRDHRLDLESCRRVLRKMESEGIEIPEGRETKIVQEVREILAKKKKIDFSGGPKFSRPYLKELEELEQEAKGWAISDDKSSQEKGKNNKAAKEVEEPEEEDEVDREDGEDEEIEEYGEEDEDGEPKKTYETKGAMLRRLKQLQYRRKRDQSTWDTIDSLMDERDRMAKLHRPNMPPRAKAALQNREDNWNAIISEMNDQDRADFLLYRDNLHVFRQASSSPSEVRIKGVTGKNTAEQRLKPPPGSAVCEDDPSLDPRQPLLSWDRRDREPLVVEDSEFYPNTECVLMDIQPKSMHRSLRAMGHGTSRAGDHSELIIKSMMSCGAESVSSAIEAVWPGAAAGVLPNCPSLYDVRRGGCPVGGKYGELTARSLNERQWIEILEAWMAWPFRPTLGQLVQRISEEGFDLEDDKPRAD